MLVGFLLHGPTGVGKTAIAMRVAYEARADFKLLAVSCAEIINKVGIYLVYKTVT